MKKIFISLFLFLGPCYIFAQDYTVEYLHSYGVSYSKKRIKSASKKFEKIFINGDSLTFYSFNVKRISDGNVVGRKFSNHGIFSFTYFKKALGELSILSPPYLQEFDFIKYDWLIQDETENISGFNCKRAISGEITAWFTTDIPVFSGPAYYCGLPGLILKVVDNKRSWLITAVKVVESSPKIVLPKMDIRHCDSCESRLDEIRKYFHD